MHQYCAGVLEHVDSHHRYETQSMEEMIVRRRSSIGIAPLYVLVEYCSDLELGERVFWLSEIQHLEMLAADIVFM